MESETLWLGISGGYTEQRLSLTMVGMLNVQRPFMRQVHQDFAYCLDAPETMPAGALFRDESEFEPGERVAMAILHTVERPGKWWPE